MLTIVLSSPQWGVDEGMCCRIPTAAVQLGKVWHDLSYLSVLRSRPPITVVTSAGRSRGVSSTGKPIVGINKASKESWTIEIASRRFAIVNRIA